MSEIVINVDAIEATQMLHTPFHTGETVQGFGGDLYFDAHVMGSGNSGERIFHIMHTGQLPAHLRTTHNFSGGSLAVFYQFESTAVFVNGRRIPEHATIGCLQFAHFFRHIDAKLLSRTPTSLCQDCFQ